MSGKVGDSHHHKAADPHSPKHHDNHHHKHRSSHTGSTETHHHKHRASATDSHQPKIHDHHHHDKKHQSDGFAKASATDSHQPKIHDHHHHDKKHHSDGFAKSHSEPLKHSDGFAKHHSTKHHDHHHHDTKHHDHHHHDTKHHDHHHKKKIAKIKDHNEDEGCFQSHVATILQSKWRAKQEERNVALLRVVFSDARHRLDVRHHKEGYDNTARDWRVIRKEVCEDVVNAVRKCQVAHTTLVFLKQEVNRHAQIRELRDKALAAMTSKNDAKHDDALWKKLYGKIDHGDQEPETLEQKLFMTDRAARKLQLNFTSKRIKAIRARLQEEKEEAKRLELQNKLPELEERHDRLLRSQTRYKQMDADAEKASAKAAAYMIKTVGGEEVQDVLNWTRSGTGTHFEMAQPRASCIFEEPDSTGSQKEESLRQIRLRLYEAERQEGSVDELPTESRRLSTVAVTFEQPKPGEAEPKEDSPKQSPRHRCTVYDNAIGYSQSQVARRVTSNNAMVRSPSDKSLWRSPTGKSFPVDKTFPLLVKSKLPCWDPSNHGPLQITCTALVEADLGYCHHRSLKFHEPADNAAMLKCYDPLVSTSDFRKNGIHASPRGVVQRSLTYASKPVGRAFVGSPTSTYRTAAVLVLTPRLGRPEANRSSGGYPPQKWGVLHGNRV